MERLNTNMESQGNNEASMDLIVSRAMAAVKEDQKQDIVHETPILKNSVKGVLKNITTFGLVGGIALGATGCADRMITTDTSGEITPTSTSENVTTNGTTSLSTSEVTVTPENTSGTKVTANTEATDPKVTVKPATTVGTSAETQYVTPNETTIPTTAETTINAELAAAPEISGLSKEIQDGKVVYKAVEGNEYGIEVGKYAGEYNPNVSIEGEQVGAVALEPEVVTKILNDELAKIPEGEDKMKVVIPLDITEVTSETGFNIEDTIEIGLSEYLGKETHIMIVEFNDPLTFINPCIENNQIGIIDGFTSDDSFKKENGEIKTIGGNGMAGLIPFSCFEQNNTEMGVEDVYYIFGVSNQSKISTFNQEKTYTVGEKTDVQVKSILSIWFDYYGLQETTTDDLLKLSDGTVVFTCPQETVVTETNN